MWNETGVRAPGNRKWSSLRMVNPARSIAVAVSRLRWQPPNRRGQTVVSRARWRHAAVGCPGPGHWLSRRVRPPKMRPARRPAGVRRRPWRSGRAAHAGPGPIRMRCVARRVLAVGGYDQAPGSVSGGVAGVGAFDDVPGLPEPGEDLRDLRTVALGSNLRGKEGGHHVIL